MVLVVVLVSGVKQSHLLVLRHGLDFDKNLRPALHFTALKSNLIMKQINLILCQITATFYKNI